MLVVVVVINSLALGNLRCILTRVLRLIDICRSLVTEFNHDPHLMERVLELVKECLAMHAFASHLEQEAQARMPRVRIGAMLTNDFVICFEERPEWESIDFGLVLGAGDNLEEKADIYSAVRVRSTVAGSNAELPSSERDEPSSVTVRR